MNVHKNLFIFVVSTLVLLCLILALSIKKNRTRNMVDSNIECTQSLSIKTSSAASTLVKPYQVKEFTIIMGAKKFSNKQINDHKQLYAGYVNKRNEIEQSLQAVDMAQANNISYSIFRGLKLSETFTRNAALLHELYFENIGTGTKIGRMTQEIITKNFGSVEAFKQDLMATALSARGWVLTSYNIDDHRVQNYLLDAHNEKVPVLTVPLLVVDTYEHAYMIDFGINRKEYLAVLWDNINWDVVEKRVEKWISA